MTYEPIKCDCCDASATKKITFLLTNARGNPASSGYRKDDISWCQDFAAFACDEHEKQVERNSPEDMEYCATFTNGVRFAHMFQRKIARTTPV